MGKRSFLEVVRKGIISLVDPEREERRKGVADALYRELSKKQKEFRFEEFKRNQDLDPVDLVAAAEHVYSRCLNTAWRDQQLSKSESESLRWIATALCLTGTQVQTLNRAKGKDVFESLLANAMADGHVDEAEGERLRQLAQWTGSSVRELVQEYFDEAGERFLSGIFLQAVSDGQLGETEWKNLVSSSQRLGFTQSELLERIRPQAKLFVEHVLADAKSDGELTENEHRVFEHLLARFQLPDDFTSYVRGEIAELDRKTQERRLITEIAQGRLPSVMTDVSVELRAGEVVHYHGRAALTLYKERKSGTFVDLHEGTGTITDSRFIFSSPTKTVSVGLRQIIGLHSHGPDLEIRTSGKGAGLYRFMDQERIAQAIFRTAVGRANQTIVEQVDAGPVRHIPRDVRQRVWQKYGGRCVDCGATQYLEFDHIIPHSRGGSNAEANVQLLCRKCNLKKSDNI